MRLAAQVKSGFYPAPPEAIAHIAQYLQAPETGRFAMLDPCAGQGDAIVQLATALECSLRDVYAIELDGGRAQTLHDALDEAGGNVLAPASYFGCSVPAGTLSFIWCNPPFDDEYGGGSRTEREFLDRATMQLKTHGVLALVCPYKTAHRYDVRQLFKTWYDDVWTVPFPDAVRRFNEVVMLGVKRASMESYWNRPDADVFRLDPKVYCIPNSSGPRTRFVKVEMTEEELADELAKSPLNERLQPPVEVAIARPPLELGTGHLALLLASGHLDGLVQPPGEPPHVVRGTARKAEYVKESERKEDKGGGITQKTVLGEKIELIIRAVDREGVIRTFIQSGTPPAAPEPVAPALPQPTRPDRPEPQPVVAPVLPELEPVASPGGRAFDVD